MTLKTIRIWLWAGIAVMAVILAGATFLLRQPGSAATASAGFGGGTYSLVDQRGRPVDQTMFQGHPSALFFGFTHCPEVCPTTMAEMSTWFEALGDEGKNLQAYFVTVDPERDTPEILGDYVSWVSDRITGVTGSPEEIAKIVKAWGVYAAKVPLEGDDYTMDHTASVFLLDTKGEFQGTIAYGEDSATAIGKLRNLLAKS
ncbi:Cytochrome oxidase biogenesis protein Sco1/SenC/PrrC, putative copper metallochaperone [Devosia sp. LC5]|uniref:SCO family protein n=1 Tax=Devosia sp. LC5 TaxID=1502724 RepID=UPI0004E3FE51|nr:SCO family protein [Devosia sp. LC5]KFC61338.1 Cytochrome oxidase biogenesis protein Sco1/SenC/PrrC, putative copper metallochaperone [Devosia sp. LC5]